MPSVLYWVCLEELVFFIAACVVHWSPDQKSTSALAIAEQQLHTIKAFSFSCCPEGYSQPEAYSRPFEIVLSNTRCEKGEQGGRSVMALVFPSNHYTWQSPASPQGANICLPMGPSVLPVKRSLSQPMSCSCFCPSISLPCPAQGSERAAGWGLSCQQGSTHHRRWHTLPTSTEKQAQRGSVGGLRKGKGSRFYTWWILHMVTLCLKLHIPQLVLTLVPAPAQNHMCSCRHYF